MSWLEFPFFSNPCCLAYDNCQIKGSSLCSCPWGYVYCFGVCNCVKEHKFWRPDFMTMCKWPAKSELQFSYTSTFLLVLVMSVTCAMTYDDLFQVSSIIPSSKQAPSNVISSHVSLITYLALSRGAETQKWRGSRYTSTLCTSSPLRVRKGKDAMHTYYSKGPGRCISKP